MIITADFTFINYGGNHLNGKTSGIGDAAEDGTVSICGSWNINATQGGWLSANAEINHKQVSAT